MNPTAKYVNLILYKIGQGGNFLSRLFALSDDTQFLWIQGTCDCRPKDHSIGEKLKYYWYFPEKINRWLRDAHLTPTGLYLCHNYMDLWEKNPIIISCIHYEHLNIQDIPNHIKPKYFFIKTSDLLFKNMKNNLNINKVNDEKFDENVRTTLVESASTDYIDLDLLINEETFEQEYHRVCESMGLQPIDTETAISFLHNWKYFRIDRTRLYPRR